MKRIISSALCFIMLFTLCLPVFADPGDNVCEIDGVGYTTLDEALAAVESGGDKTIKLLGNINFNGGIMVENKSITFDLNGCTLNIVNDAEEDTPEEMSGLYMKGNAAVSLEGEGAFNVTGSWYGVFAECDSDNGESLEVTVTNATGMGRDGVAAQGGAKVVVKGNATTNGNDSSGYEYSGVWASDAGTEVTVEGNVYANGVSGVGVRSDESAFVEVKGNIIVNGSNSIGVKAGEDGDVTVDGNVNASGDGCIGVYLLCAEGMPSIVTIKRDINAQKYVIYEAGEETWEDGFEDGRAGSETVENFMYYTYDGLSYVYVSMFAGGSGSSDDPYLIANEMHLYNVRKYFMDGKHFKQTANIDLSGFFSLGEGWNPICVGEAPFIGTYDGDGFTISNLRMDRERYHVGLFGAIGEGSEIRNVGLINVDVKGEGYVGALAGVNAGTVANSYATGDVYGDYEYVGGLIGVNSVHSEITGCHFEGTVESAGDFAGGLTGANFEDAVITDCYADADVTNQGDCTGGLVGVNSGSIFNSHSICDVEGFGSVGGLAGENSGDDAVIQESYADGSVTGTSKVGGLAGYSAAGITDSYFTGTVTNCGHTFGFDLGNYTGGLVGESNGSITNSHADAAVTAEGDYAGGLAGTSSGSISGSYSAGSVAGKSYVGGLVGESYGTKCIIASYSTCAVEGEMYVGGLAGSNEIRISECYAKGDVTNPGEDDATYTYFGGLAGKNTGSIENSYAWGDVEGNQYVGGLVGYNEDDVVNCYAIGKVTGDGGGVGPLIGFSLSAAEITGSFWNNNTSGHDSSNYGIEAGSGTMKQQATYQKMHGDEEVYWDFDTVWGIAHSTSGYNEGYPYLKWELPEEFEGGSGTEDDPYVISTADQLNNVRNHLDKHFRLINDLDLDFYRSGSGWEPVGTKANPFTGTFDGGGYKISGLFIVQEGVYDNRVPAGLFGYTGAEAKIHDLELFDINITGCYYVGGLVGYNSGEINNVYVSGSVTGEWDTGGLAGLNKGSVANSAFTGDITGTDEIEYGDWTGGLVGYNLGTITRCRADASVTSEGDNVGGLAGENLTNGIITESYSAGNVTAHYYSGGLAGANSGRITACYSICDVNGGNNVGGLVGGNSGQIEDCFAAGVIVGADDVGGFAGSSIYAVVTGCYWDIEATGQTESACGTGKTTADMKQITTYENWDFITIWDISADFNEGYPFLRWEADTPPVISDTGVGAVTDTTAALSFTSNKTGIYYYLVYKHEYGTPVPDADTVRAQGEGAAARGTGTAAAAANEIVLTGLTASTEYNAYIVVEYAQGNISDVAVINFTTAAVSAGPGVAPSSLGITRGDTGVFYVSLGHSGNGAESATVTSNDTSIATVNPSIVNNSGQAISVTGISAGSTTVTVAFSGGNYTGGDIIVNVTVTDPVITMCNINFYSDGSLYAAKTVTLGSALGSNWPDDPARSGYIFGGWFTGQDGAGSQCTSSTIFIDDVNLYAKWVCKDSGDKGSSGGGTPSDPQTLMPPPAPAYSAEVKKGSGAKTAIPVTILEGTGTASIEAGLQSLTLAGTVITIPSIPDVDTYITDIPVLELSTDQVQGTLTLNTDVGSITVPSNMLSGVEGTDGEKAQITIGQGDKADLPEDVRDQIGDRPLVRLKLSIDGRQVDWSNQDAPVTISIPYTPTEAELANPESIVVWYIDGSGNAVCVPNGRYDPVTGTVVFTTTHFSYYAVCFRQVSFNDVPKDAWYARAVSFIAARDITTGTGGGNFGPEAKLTRGQFIVMLMKAYGIAPDAAPDPERNFADAGSAYYTGYLAAAKRLGISAGVGNNMFAPEREITRQEMFTLLYNALKAIGKLPEGTAGKPLTAFADAGDIASWAKEAMELLTETGAIGGSGGRLYPTRTTTRAEMAQVLFNLGACHDR